MYCHCNAVELWLKKNCCKRTSVNDKANHSSRYSSILSKRNYVEWKTCKHLIRINGKRYFILNLFGDYIQCILDIFVDRCKWYVYVVVVRQEINMCALLQHHRKQQLNNPISTNCQCQLLFPHPRYTISVE